MEKIKSFLEKHNMLITDPDIMIRDYINKAKIGLEIADAGPFTMTPSYISIGDDIPINEKAIVIDVGGTNLRIALVRFNEKLELVVDKIEKLPMLGTQGRLTAAEFFDRMAEYLIPFVNECKLIGFVFSFPCDILSNIDGKIIMFDKEVDIPDAPGHIIGKELNEALHKKGITEDCLVMVMNDTISTLMGGVSYMKQYDCNNLLGMILGTGFNIAYIEQWSNIAKIPEMNLSLGSTTISMESGGYDGMLKSSFDIRVQAEADHPGYMQLEKMVSGVYQGMVVKEMLKAAAKEGLLSDKGAEGILKIQTITAIDMDAFVRDCNGENLLAGILPDIDKPVVQELIDYYYRRTAYLVATALTATIVLSYDEKKSNKPACVVIDGSTYYKTISFKPYFEKYMKEICERKYGYKYIFVKVDDGNFSGAASAALMNKKNSFKEN